MNRTFRWFVALILAQALFLLAWAGFHERVRQNAPVILLKGRPVDPQDLLRGDYLTLDYDISEIPAGDPAAALNRTEFTKPDVWVLLEPRGRYYVAVKMSRQKIEPAPGQIMVRGELAQRWTGGRTTTQHVEYGIEKYFVPEGRGRPTFKLMEVEVSVSPAHRLYLRRVLLDGHDFP
jgi:uncharacterized membrane-anchored protein